MRYLLASDLHYRLRQFDWIAEQAVDFDAVVLSGDHLDLAGHADLIAQIAMLTRWFTQLAESATLIVNSGNHDLSRRGEHGEKEAAWLSELPSSVHSDGSTTDVGPDVVSSCAWWEGPTTKEAVRAQLSATERPTDGTWIWAYHSPPDKSPTSWSGRRHYGDELLNELIEAHAPDLVLSGHVHEAPHVPGGRWHDRIGDTLILNAGRQAGDIPAHIVIDTGAGVAERWTFESGLESIAID